FAIGQLSGFVEFLSAIMGFIAVYFIEGLLPYALSFAAGAMIFVVIEELLPESQNNKHNELATIFTLGGFVLMMFLDLVL
ncbi:MAG TPA: ZIP family metal transporter, partial [Bacteroidales bacterium]|nr:ZIP family metal transporter [Bacteroidales bacterium]